MLEGTIINIEHKVFEGVISLTVSIPLPLEPLFSEGKTEEGTKAKKEEREYEEALLKLLGEIHPGVVRLTYIKDKAQSTRIIRAANPPRLFEGI